MEKITYLLSECDDYGDGTDDGCESQDWDMEPCDDGWIGGSDECWMNDENND